MHGNPPYPSRGVRAAAQAPHYLYRKDGVWEGKRILPEGWVAQSTRPAVTASSPRKERKYGFQWWLLPYQGREPSLAPAALGYGGQVLFVVQEYDLRAVVTGWNIYDKPSVDANKALEAVVESVR